MKTAGLWWCTPLIPALRRQRQGNLCEFEVSLVNRVSSRTETKATQKPCLKKQTNKQNEDMGKKNKRTVPHFSPPQPSPSPVMRPPEATVLHPASSPLPTRAWQCSPSVWSAFLSSAHKSIFTHASGPLKQLFQFCPNFSRPQPIHPSFNCQVMT